MRTRILGKNLEVSAVGLGCMGMSHAYGTPPERKAMRELLAQAVDLGYTFFDTAELRFYSGMSGMEAQSFRSCCLAQR